MRVLLPVLLFLLSPALRAATDLPEELSLALERLQTDAPRGWGFTQTTEAAGRSRVERYEPLGPEPARWRLLQVDGREPTAEELEEYRKHQALRAGGQSAPNVKDQIDRATAELVADEGPRTTWRFQLQPGSEDDDWAPFMEARFTLHHPSQTIEQVELVSPAPFSPMLAVNVKEARTLMTYSLPTDDRPPLLQRIEVRVRGRAWFIRSLDSDMTVTYSDYRFVGKR